MLQLGELAAWERDPTSIRAEIHEHGVIFHAEYDAEPVLVVRHLIVDSERLGRGRWVRGAERAARQPAPGRVTRCLHVTIMHLPRHKPARQRLPAATAARAMTAGQVVSMVHCIK